MKTFQKKNTLQHSKEKQVKQYTTFWKWFTKHQKAFYNILNSKDTANIELNFFDPLMEQLTPIREDCFFLAGMDQAMAELIITADGDIKNIAFIEDLIAQAPVLPNWRFIASKPESPASLSTIKIHGYSFDTETQHFYAVDTPNHPDRINITILNEDYTEENKEQITHGVYLFLDNLLGEVKTLSLIDAIEVRNHSGAEKELIPIEKLKSYLEWREKEFIEKYEYTCYDIQNEKYAGLSANTHAGNPVLLMVNCSAMEWNGSASHRWILTIIINYDGQHNDGLPEPETNKAMDRIEDRILEELPASRGTIYLGRETYEGNRHIYLASHDFREPSRVADFISNLYSKEFQIEWDIYKDKYWLSLDRFKSENWLTPDDDEGYEE